MKSILTSSIFCVALASCGETEYFATTPEIDPELLTPVPQPKLQDNNVASLGVLLIDLQEGLSTANSRICGVRQVVIEYGQDLVPCPEEDLDEPSGPGV